MLVTSGITKSKRLYPQWINKACAAKVLRASTYQQVWFKTREDLERKIVTKDVSASEHTNATIGLAMVIIIVLHEAQFSALIKFSRD